MGKRLSNLFDLPRCLPRELVEPLLSTHDFRVERIVSQGHASPDELWYDQDEHEWVLVIQGAARLQFEDETVELAAGDFVNIPAHKRHRVKWTDPAVATVWLAIYYSAPPPTNQE